MKEGFYNLISEDEKEPVLAHGYHCTDLEGEFVFGFNTHDGGGLVKLTDLSSDTKVTPVTVLPQSEAVLSPAGALYGFAAWLTTRQQAVTASADHDASVWADLVKEFCEANNLGAPVDGDMENLKHPE